MISQNALHHAEKCRFCWMCRHLCPVQHQTGKELSTPRAKGLLLSMAAWPAWLMLAAGLGLLPACWLSERVRKRHGLLRFHGILMNNRELNKPGSRPRP